MVRDKTTGDEVRDLLGPPWEPIYYARMERDVWTYPMRIESDPTPKWFVVYIVAGRPGARDATSSTT